MSLADIPSNTKPARNPFRRVISESHPTSLSVSTSTERPRSVSANNPFTKSLQEEPPSPTMTVTSGPPLPPRKPLQPPPKREPATLTRSATLPTRRLAQMNIISSSDTSQPHHTQLAQDSLFGTKPPVLLPKPKFVKSSHIDPSTNMRPLAKAHGRVEEEHKPPPRTSSLASTSSSSADDPSEWAVRRDRASSLATSVAQSSPGPPFKPPIPPKRRPGSFMLPPASAKSLQGPSSAVSAPTPPQTRPQTTHSRSSSMTYGKLALNRPLDEILGPGMERTQIWVNSAVNSTKRHFEAHVGSTNERQGLMKDSSTDDERDTINDEEDEELEHHHGRDTHEPGWQRLG
jgi:hypothetical protein